MGRPRSHETGTARDTGGLLPPIGAGVARAFAPKSTVSLDPRAGTHGVRLVLRTRPEGPEIELNRALTCSIAHALWEARGGGPETNWVDAETALGQLLALLGRPSAEAEAKPAAANAARR